MEKYIIKNTDIMLNGKLFTEGSTIELNDKDAQSLSDFLVILNDSEGSKNKNIQPVNKNNKRSK